jgi:MFS family permease
MGSDGLNLPETKANESSNTPTLVGSVLEHEKYGPTRVSTPPPPSLDKQEAAMDNQLDMDKQSGNDEDPENEIEYADSFALFLITIGLSFAVFLIALDQTIIATAIPAITDQFQALDDVGWYGSAYMLTLCSFQLFYGKIYSYFSTKWTFLAAIGLFELGSLICGVAPNSVTLIIGRAVAGMGCAGIFSGALIIVGISVSLKNRPIYTGLLGGVYGISSVAGPLLGGVFTDNVSWRWCFYVNLPFGAITIIAIGLFFHPPTRKKVDTMTWQQKLRDFDTPGTLVLLPAVVCLLFVLQWGGTKHKWKSGTIIGLLVTFAVLALAFIAIQLQRQERATVPPRILRQRSIGFGCLVAFSVGGAFFILVYYIPVWFQAIQGVSAIHSGIRNLPFIFGVTVFSIVAGGLTTVFGYYMPFIFLGSILTAIGSGLLTTWHVGTPVSKWVGYQVIAGTGVGMVLQQPLMACQAVLKQEDVPIGTSVVIFFQMLGSALFISVGQNIFTNKLVEGIAQTVPSVSAEDVLQTGATALTSHFSKADLPKIEVAYSHAITQIFYAATALSIIAFFAALGMEWVSVKDKKIEHAAGA